VQQAYGKHRIDADAALRNLPQWPGIGVGEYRALRTVPAAAGNSSPALEARTVLTIYGLFHAHRNEEHPLVHAFRKAVKVGAERQDGATLSPLEVRPITVESAELVALVNQRADTNITADELGLLLRGESPTVGGGVKKAGTWTWDLARHRPLRPYATPDARGYLVELDTLLAAKSERPYTPVSPESLPRALDHLNVVWKALTRQRLFYPRGLAAAASLVEPVGSGDEFTARLGALADVFDLFMRTADGRPPAGGSLTAFREELVSRLPSAAEHEKAREAIGQLMDVNRIRNGRLHADASNWAESLRRLGVPASELPSQQWDRIRGITVDAVYVIIESLQPLIG
jgi:hypothetical protein